MSEQTQRRAFYPFMFSLVLAAGVFLGYIVSRSAEDKPLLPTGSPQAELEEILGYIDAQYVDAVNTDSLRILAISEMFRHLDPHSFYIPPSHLRAANEELDAQLQGIGIEFDIVRDTITVVHALAGYPAEQVGLQPGDKIIRINDTVVAGIGITNELVQKKLKGPQGTQVRVTVVRGHPGVSHDFTITRELIQLKSLIAAHMMDEHVGYIKVTQFTEKTHQEFIDAVRLLKQQGMTAMLLDLRDNGGGYLDAAVNIADEFIGGRRVLVYTEGLHSPREKQWSGTAGVFETGPVVVLINEGSASASEILAGALQDWTRATIVGRRSFGKGLVQGQIKLSGGGAIRLTHARYYTPKGHNIQRPYRNGVDAYYAELNQRLIETYAQQDSSYRSDTIPWGIMPEVFIPVDTTEPNVVMRKLIGEGIIPDFAYMYFGEHRHNLEYSSIETFERGFKVDPELWSAFRTFAIQRQSELSADAIDRASDKISVAIAAFIAKQLFYQDGYYRTLNRADREVQIARKAFSDAGRITSSGKPTSPEPR